MRPMLLFVLVAIAPAAVNAQSIPSTHEYAAFTVTAGEGNAMGWSGVQVERYLRNGRISVFGGGGFATLIEEEGESSSYRGPAFAGGLRVYTNGARQRAFLEVSDSVVAVQKNCGANCHAFYGPGVQVGYQFAARRGFTAVGSAGYGYTPSGSTGGLLVGMGAGFTWRRG